MTSVRASGATLLVATRNRGKLEELARMLAGSELELAGLFDRPEIPDVIEDGETFEENAVKKACEYARAARMLTLADDSGLEVDALGGAPGVRSARFAGAHGDDRANWELLLERLSGVGDEERSARFRCVLALADANGEQLHVCSGTLEGSVAHAPRGTGGFGYDPIFLVAGTDRTLAELRPEEKDARSHRGAALRAMVPTLRQLAARR